MAELQADFEILPRSTIEAEIELPHRSEMEATFEINVTRDGRDATINGVNTLTLNADNGITLVQDGDVATIDGTLLQQADEELSQRIDNVVQDKTFIFEQGIASSVWVIHHNLDKYPSVSVVDSAGNEIIAEVTYDDTNTCTVVMAGEQKGKAYLN